MMADDRTALRVIADAFPVGMVSGERDRLEMASIMLRRLKEQGYTIFQFGSGNSSQFKAPPGFN